MSFDLLVTIHLWDSLCLTKAPSLCLDHMFKCHIPHTIKHRPHTCQFFEPSTGFSTSFTNSKLPSCSPTSSVSCHQHRASIRQGKRSSTVSDLKASNTVPGGPGVTEGGVGVGMTAGMAGLGVARPMKDFIELGFSQ